ncbi:MAG TPA: NAD(P)/FAD-dependent oxidoreductase [Candidatus Angelobacter sp.]|nr:NAD(P)/FAD-dependent oxidoreductase [Candidatus Angelobacter sp.]
MDPVVIIGGGPAASSVGSYLSMAGINNVILEKTHHPRAHVGESLVVSTTRIFQEIGFIQTMENEGFVRKYGAAWHPPGSGGSVFLQFREFPIEGVHQDYTYHVDRSRFDLLLLKHAESLGSKVYQGVHVKQVTFDDKGYANGVEVDFCGKNIKVPGSMVVDASGRATVLGTQLGFKKMDPLFNQFAVHAWFKDVERGETFVDDFIHIYFLPVERGWAWQIPITDKITSVGVVAERDVFRNANRNYAGWFEELSKLTPTLANAMRNANRINEFKIEADYSYCMDRFCGNGFLLVGDAARFVDPIFSSGVSVALYSGKLAAEQIIKALNAGDTSDAALQAYEAVVRKGTRIWYEFIQVYYKLLPLFTYFIQHPDYREQIFHLLQGEVYYRENVPVLDAMRKRIEAIDKNEKHLLRQHLDPRIILESIPKG